VGAGFGHITPEKITEINPTDKADDLLQLPRLLFGAAEYVGRSSLSIDIQLKNGY
jgi:hypothetical protein